MRDTVLHMKELSKSENEKVTSPGMSQLSGNVSKGDAALEFIKHVCAVLALDQNVQHDVLVFYLISSTYQLPFSKFDVQFVATIETNYVQICSDNL